MKKEKQHKSRAIHVRFTASNMKFIESWLKYQQQNNRNLAINDIIAYAETQFQNHNEKVKTFALKMKLERISIEELKQHQ